MLDPLHYCRQVGGRRLSSCDLDAKCVSGMGVGRSNYGRH